MREFLTDEQVEQEIARLSKSEAVKLARREARIKIGRRQRMYTLRSFEKRGKAGITLGMLINLEVLEVPQKEIDNEQEV